MSKFYTAFFLLVFLLVSCSEEQKNNNSKSIKKNTAVGLNIDTITSETPTVPIQKRPLDTLQTSIAQFIAGMPLEHLSALSEKTSSDTWKNHATRITEGWETADTKRLEKLRTWSKNDLQPLINDSLPLFYPFSGPDFLHANSFYPNASDYYFIAIEPVFDLPAIDQLADAGFLNALQKSLRDILGKSYFITTHMMEDLKAERADGVLPLFYAFLARTGHEIIDVYPIQLDTNGMIYTHDSLNLKTTQAVRFDIRKKGSNSIKTLSYFNRSISDRDLAVKHPNFKMFLENNVPPCNSFVKAASYLMHYAGFGIVRDAVLAKSQSLFQDDTGVPLRYTIKDNWSVRLYGAYTRPIKNFTAKMYQSDLKALYASTPEKEKYTIPFSLGYHIVGDKIQNHQLFIRR